MMRMSFRVAITILWDDTPPDKNWVGRHACGVRAGSRALRAQVREGAEEIGAGAERGDADRAAQRDGGGWIAELKTWRRS
jgi:hypothetical protein